MSNGKLGLAVNPMSGRDVRRLAARATNMTHEAKRDIVARVAAGAEAAGVTDIYITKEPFQISSMALDHMGLKANVHVIEHPLANDASDTEQSVRAFVAAGCSTLVSLGGDGTNRAIVRACPDIDLVPLSTGTNNVFPVLAEPTIAGVVAGLNASGKLDAAPELKARVKVLHVKAGARRDVGLIDAVLLENDNVGNLLPFDADRIAQVLLTRAEPNSIGMSPIGGLIRPVYAEDDYGMLVMTGGEGPGVLAPLSPGLFREVTVSDVTDINFEVAVPFRGPGVLALDGDRDIWLAAGETATVTLRRDGPCVIDIEATMRWAVAQGMMAPAKLTRTNDDR
ncbi:MAG: NAD(+)/NADH kinase [Pseudomonadales bacterium]|jgi:predicted polyphosphate/ATP-dependent NAD kinase|nr:NAD(+)/NADH kinase [Pseudomonadales bacterium]